MDPCLDRKTQDPDPDLKWHQNLITWYLVPSKNFIKIRSELLKIFC